MPLMKMIIFGCFLLLILPEICAKFSGIDPGKQPAVEAKTKVEQKHYYYDKYGNLILNGSVPGNSSAITIDFKKYYPTCFTNVYFNFIFYFAPNAEGEICEEGMTICYEAQLFGEHVRPEYSLPNLNNTANPDSLQYYVKCLDGTNSKSKSLRGLNVAVKTISGLSGSDIKSEAKNFALPKQQPKNNVWRFFVISSSFLPQKYYFIVPKDNTAVLQIGQGKTMDLRVTDTEGVDLPLVTFKQKGKEFGTKTFGGPAPDMNNGKRLVDFIGLWLLYLDFKSDYTQWQTISVVNPRGESKCQLMTEIRGNRMRACRSYFEDIAVLEPVNANVKMIYTSEVGTVRHQDYGQEDVRSTSTRWQKEQLRQSTTIDNTDSSDSTKVMNEDMMKELTTKEKTVTTEHIHKGEMEFSLNANPEKAVRDQAGKAVGQGSQSGANARVGVGASYANTELETESTKDEHEKVNIQRTTDNTFNDIKKSTAMMESFKSTSGASEAMEQSEYLRTSNAFTTRETVDIRITLPRNKKVVIKQLFFDCDGNTIKMPFILYTDGKERLKLLEENASNKIQRPLQPNWANETSEGNLPDRMVMKSMPIMQQEVGNDFDDFMNEYDV